MLKKNHELIFFSYVAIFHNTFLPKAILPLSVAAKSAWTVITSLKDQLMTLNTLVVSQQIILLSEAFCESWGRFKKGIWALNSKSS